MTPDDIKKKLILWGLPAERAECIELMISTVIAEAESKAYRDIALRVVESPRKPRYSKHVALGAESFLAARREKDRLRAQRKREQKRANGV